MTVYWVYAVRQDTIYTGAKLMTERVHLRGEKCKSYKTLKEAKEKKKSTHWMCSSYR